MSGTHAKPYSGKDPINTVNWANYVAPSPLEMSGKAYQQYDGTNSDIEHTDAELEDTPLKGSERDGVSNSYEGNGQEEEEYSAMGHASPKDNSAPARPRNPTNNVHQKGKFDMNPRELQTFLSQFYLIRTPYGYILGRVNPAISSSKITRRSMQTPQSRMKASYGSLMSPSFGTYVPPFGIRRPAERWMYAKLR